MDRYVVDLNDVDGARVVLVGGKGTGLAALARVDGVRVPEGFCLTTEAWVRCAAPAVADPVDRLTRVPPDDDALARGIAAEIRDTIASVALADDVARALDAALARHGAGTAWAVRSSATAEDLPTLSFAGQHDSVLGVVGPDDVRHAVRRCWASLFSDRAVAYRRRHGVDHRLVRMAVVVQRMVAASASGVLFTADPLTGNRAVAVVEAVPGLGDAFVAGRTRADTYAVRADAVTRRAPDDTPRALDDAQVLALVRAGRRIERHAGAPQDVEWCLADDGAWIVQSRPITTLFPIPAVDDEAPRVYLSVGHQQMMTDAMSPLGISIWQLAAARPMHEAGGRLFVEVSDALATPAGQAGLLGLAGRSDPLTGDALRTLVARGFVPSRPDAAPAAPTPAAAPPLEPDPRVVAELVASAESSIARLAREIDGATGVALLDRILADADEHRRVLFDATSHRAIMAGIDATWWLNERLREWLDLPDAAHGLAQSAPGNVTSEMGLALLDVADAIRPHPEVVAFLERVEGDDFLERLPALPGGRAARDAIARWLDRYGMRGVGEIDVARPRWRERPATLVPLLLGHVRHFAPGEAARRFERGRRASERMEQDVLARLRRLPDGERKAEETRQAIARLRTFAGYREYPKYAKIRREYVYRQAIVAEARRLVAEGVLRDADDVFLLTLQELREVVHARRADEGLLRARRERLRWHRTLTPPRVLTSEGEVLSGALHRGDAPDGALVGLAVSSGVVEGRARVVLDVAAADLAPGDVLVTTFTDPSWTPAFVAAAGLVTEVGGLTTHGAVIAREYGLPAVVGVEGATRRIRDGQRVRVDGTAGWVELLD